MGVTQVISAAGSSSTESVLRKHRNRRKLSKKKGPQAVSAAGPSSVAAEDRMDLVEVNEMSTSQPIGIVQSSNGGEGEDDDALMINDDVVPAGGSGAPVFAPLSADAVKSSTIKGDVRRVLIPPHRMSPLKRDWINLFGPLTEILGLQVRMNVQKRCVEMRVSGHEC